MNKDEEDRVLRLCDGKLETYILKPFLPKEQRPFVYYEGVKKLFHRKLKKNNYIVPLEQLLGSLYVQDSYEPEESAEKDNVPRFLTPYLENLLKEFEAALSEMRKHRMNVNGHRPEDEDWAAPKLNDSSSGRPRPHQCNERKKTESIEAPKDVNVTDEQLIMSEVYKSRIREARSAGQIEASAKVKAEPAGNPKICNNNVTETVVAVGRGRGRGRGWFIQKSRDNPRPPFASTVGDSMVNSRKKCNKRPDQLIYDPARIMKERADLELARKADANIFPEDSIPPLLKNCLIFEIDDLPSQPSAPPPAPDTPYFSNGCDDLHLPYQPGYQTLESVEQNLVSRYQPDDCNTATNSVAYEMPGAWLRSLPSSDAVGHELRHNMDCYDVPASVSVLPYPVPNSGLPSGVAACSRLAREQAGNLQNAEDCSVHTVSGSEQGFHNGRYDVAESDEVSNAGPPQRGIAARFMAEDEQETRFQNGYHDVSHSELPLNGPGPVYVRENLTRVTPDQETSFDNVCYPPAAMHSLHNGHKTHPVHGPGLKSTDQEDLFRNCRHVTSCVCSFDHVTFHPKYLPHSQHESRPESGRRHQFGTESSFEAENAQYEQDQNRYQSRPESGRGLQFGTVCSFKAENAQYEQYQDRYQSRPESGGGLQFGTASSFKAENAQYEQDQNRYQSRPESGRGGQYGTVSSYKAQNDRYEQYQDRYQDRCDETLQPKSLPHFQHESRPESGRGLQFGAASSFKIENDQNEQYQDRQCAQTESLPHCQDESRTGLQCVVPSCETDNSENYTFHHYNFHSSQTKPLAHAITDSLAQFQSVQRVPVNHADRLEEPAQRIMQSQPGAELEFGPVTTTTNNAQNGAFYRDAFNTAGEAYPLPVLHAQFEPVRHSAHQTLQHARSNLVRPQNVQNQPRYSATVVPNAPIPHGLAVHNANGDNGFVPASSAHLPPTQANLSTGDQIDISDIIPLLDRPGNKISAHAFKRWITDMYQKLACDGDKAKIGFMENSSNESTDDSTSPRSSLSAIPRASPPAMPFLVEDVPPADIKRKPKPPSNVEGIEGQKITGNVDGGSKSSDDAAPPTSLEGVKESPPANLKTMPKPPYGYPEGLEGENVNFRNEENVEGGYNLSLPPCFETMPNPRHNSYPEYIERHNTNGSFEGPVEVGYNMSLPPGFHTKPNPPNSYPDYIDGQNANGGIEKPVERGGKAESFLQAILHTANPAGVEASPPPSFISKPVSPPNVYPECKERNANKNIAGGFKMSPTFNQGLQSKPVPRSNSHLATPEEVVDLPPPGFDSKPVPLPNFYAEFIDGQHVNKNVAGDYKMSPKFNRGFKPKPGPRPNYYGGGCNRNDNIENSVRHGFNRSYAHQYFGAGFKQNETNVYPPNHLKVSVEKPVGGGLNSSYMQQIVDRGFQPKNVPAANVDPQMFLHGRVDKPAGVSNNSYTQQVVDGDFQPKIVPPANVNQRNLHVGKPVGGGVVQQPFSKTTGFKENPPKVCPGMQNLKGCVGKPEEIGFKATYVQQTFDQDVGFCGFGSGVYDFLRATVDRGSVLKDINGFSD